MSIKNEKLGAVYLVIYGLDKERFKDVTNCMVSWVNIPYAARYIESCSDGVLSGWVITDEPESNSKLITLDELERLLNHEKKQQPTHFAISPEDYAEYQELKKLKETLKKLFK